MIQQRLPRWRVDLDDEQRAEVSRKTSVPFEPDYGFLARRPPLPLWARLLATVGASMPMIMLLACLGLCLWIVVSLVRDLLP